MQELKMDGEEVLYLNLYTICYSYTLFFYINIANLQSEWKLINNVRTKKKSLHSFPKSSSKQHPDNLNAELNAERKLGFYLIMKYQGSIISEFTQS